MFRILDPNKNVVGLLDHYSDYTISRKLVMDDRTLSLTTTIEDVVQNGIKLEGYIETEDDQYVIREMRTGADGTVSISAPLNVEALEGKALERVHLENVNISEAVTFVLPSDWGTVIDSGITEKRRTIYIVNTNVYEYIKKLLGTFRVECQINAKTKRVIFKEQIGEDRGAYFSDELNLRSLETDSNTYDFYTELEAYGKDDLTFESINGGLNYVTNYTYSNKKKRYIWRDERYTTKEILLEDARAKLADMAKPHVSYSVSVADLAKASSYYSALEYNIGDTVTIIDNVTKVREKRRISEIEEHPDSPENNTCVIADAINNYQDLMADIQETLDTLEAIRTADGHVRGSTVDQLTCGQIPDFTDTVDTLTADALTSPTSSTSAAVNGVIAGAIQADRANVRQLIADSIQADRINVQRLIADAIQADRINVNTLIANAIQAERITTQTLVADSIEAVEGRFETLRTQDLEAINGQFNTVNTRYLNVEETLNAANANIRTLQSDVINVRELNAADISAARAEFNTTITNQITAVHGDIDDLEARTLTVTNGLSANIANIETTFTNRLNAVDADIVRLRTTELNAAVGRITNLESDNANIKTLLAGNVGTGSLTSIVLNSDNATIDTGFLRQLIAENITVDDLLAGRISTTKFTIGSNSGNFKIEDNTLLIKDSDNHPRIQVGLDGSGDYSFIVYDATGTGQLFNANGITESGIADGLIKDAKVASDANINASKLDIQSLFTEMDASGYQLKSSIIYLNEQSQSLDVAFTNISGRVTTIGESASTAVSTSNRAERAANSAIETAQSALEVLSGISTLDALGMSLSNDAHVVHTNTDLTGGVWTDCQTRAYVYLGDSDVTSMSTFTVHPTENITGTWDEATKTYHVTAMIGTDGYVDIDALYGTGERYLASRSSTVYVSASGKAYTIPSGGSHIWKRFSVSKAPDGRVGISYNLVSSVQLIARDVVNETTFTPSTIEFKAVKNDDGVVTSVLSILVIEETDDYVTFTQKYRSSTPEASKVYTPTASATLKGIRCSAYDTTGDLLDSETVAVIADADKLKAELEDLSEDVELLGENFEDAQETIISHGEQIGGLTTSIDGLTEDLNNATSDLYAVVGANLAYQVTWVDNKNGTTTLTAHVYRIDPDTKKYKEVTNLYVDQFFTWTVRSEEIFTSDVVVDPSGAKILGYGKTITIANSEAGYDGNVDGWFIPTYEPYGLTTRSGKLLTSRSGKIFTTWINIE